jgi:Jacalin-like lectin domain
MVVPDSSGLNKRLKIEDPNRKRKKNLPLPQTMSRVYIAIATFVCLLSLFSLIGAHEPSPFTVFKNGAYCLKPSGSSRTYSTVAPAEHNITSMTLYCNNYLDGIALNYSDGSSDIVGYTNSKSFTIDLRRFPIVSSSFSCSELRVSSIYFYTEDGMPHKVCGSGSTDSHVFQLPSNYQIIGFFGQEDGTALQNIGFYYRSDEGSCDGCDDD